MSASTSGAPGRGWHRCICGCREDIKVREADRAHEDRTSFDGDVNPAQPPVSRGRCTTRRRAERSAGDIGRRPGSRSGLFAWRDPEGATWKADCDIHDVVSGEALNVGVVMHALVAGLLKVRTRKTVGRLKPTASSPPQRTAGPRRTDATNRAPAIQQMPRGSQPPVPSSPESSGKAGTAPLATLGPAWRRQPLNPIKLSDGTAINCLVHA